MCCVLPHAGMQHSSDSFDVLHFDSLTLRDEFMVHNPLKVKEKKRSIVLVSLSPDPLPTGLETVDSSSDQDVTSGDLKNSSCLDMPRKTN